MNLRRFSAIFGVEFAHSFRRPLHIIAAILVLLTAWGLSTGQVQISSGDSAVGGTKAWITSEFSQTQMMTYLTLLLYAFFIAIAAGLTLLRDRETKVDTILHSTPLTPGEYVWGRFTAVVGGIAFLLLLQALASAFFNHTVPNGSANEIRGPFHWGSYFRPIALIGFPFTVFFAGVALYLGEQTRNAILVFVLPVAALLVCGFFLWTWSPTWLDFRVNQILQVVEPTGYRWLNETLLKVDRGVNYYNKSQVPLDPLFWLNRAGLLAVGFGCVFLTRRAVAASMRGEGTRGAAAAGAAAAGATAPATPAGEATPARESALASIGMTNDPVSFFRTVGAVGGIEFHELVRQPGLYAWFAIILVQALGSALTAYGAFDTPILLTPGITAASLASQLAVLICCLLLIYTVESLERERSSGLAPILYATPIRTWAFFLGKAVANSFVAGVVMAAALLAAWIAVLVQHTVPFSLGPYVLVWGFLLVPTFFAWTAFITAVYAATGNRYGAYAFGLAALFATGYYAIARKISWATNWPLWGSFRWSDLGFYETDRVALVLNRIMVLGLAVFFTAVAVRVFRRRGSDGVRVVHAFAPAQALRTAWSLFPAAAVPLACWIALSCMVSQGLEGGAAKKASKDYWAKNLKTWMGVPLPDIARADIRLRLKPESKWIASEGTLTLVNGLDTTLAQIPMTGGLHWEHVKWTMNGKPVTPEDRLRLYVFTPPAPLAKGDSVTIGWSWDGHFPKGVTKNGGSTSEFILPSGVVLTGFEPSFMPVLGYMEAIGETKENKAERKQYRRDYWKGVTRAAFGATAWFPARVAVTGPEAYTLNSVGICTSNTVKNGERTQVWETDHPVKILNVICGRWKVKQGHGTTIYYSAAHPYNIEEMSITLDAARRYYSRWFLPYPWRELKLSEFPALAGYAQGFGTNITFSENIGFLTRNDLKRNTAALVTAHEAAHQWWGNILTPAEGPGGDFISEGMSHFSTLLLLEELKGARGRMEFAKGIEARYADRRRPDDERPMYDIDGSHDSDETVTYDRGGWVFWMLYDYLGHDRALKGYQEFIRTWSVSRDHPALQDLVAALRPFAVDPADYDRFTKQWFEEKAMPEYRLSAAAKKKEGAEYVVTAAVQNRGTGTMPVEIAAVTGERWREPKPGSETVPTEPDPGYRDARATVTLAAGESKQVTIRCAFDPKQVVVDPDVRVLQLRRKQAVAKL